MKMKIETLHQICAFKALLGVFSFMGGDVWQLCVEINMEDEFGEKKTTTELLREIKGKALNEVIAAVERATAADDGAGPVEQYAHPPGTAQHWMKASACEGR